MKKRDLKKYENMLKVFADREPWCIGKISHKHLNNNLFVVLSRKTLQTSHLKKGITPWTILNSEVR
jgi:hypothetical protein